MGVSVLHRKAQYNTSTPYNQCLILGIFEFSNSGFRLN